jgi:hypothetical protein
MISIGISTTPANYIGIPEIYHISKPQNNIFHSGTTLILPRQNHIAPRPQAKHDTITNMLLCAATKSFKKM